MGKNATSAASCKPRERLLGFISQAHVDVFVSPYFRSLWTGLLGSAAPIAPSSLLFLPILVLLSPQGLRPMTH